MEYKMIGKTIAAGAAALVLGTAGLEAAPLDLAALGFREAAQSYTGSGGVVYDSELLSSNFLSPIILTDLNADLVFLYGPGGTSTLDLLYGGAEAGDLELFIIADSGDNGSDVLELLLQRDASDLSPGNTGVGQNAILRITSADSDFWTEYFSTDPEQTGEFFAEVEVTLTALERMPAVPLPASLPLALAGLGAFVLVRHRGKP